MPTGVRGSLSARICVCIWCRRWKGQSQRNDRFPYRGNVDREHIGWQGHRLRAVLSVTSSRSRGSPTQAVALWKWAAGTRRSM